MNCAWFVAGVLVFLQMSSSLAMVMFEDDPVKVNFCCPDGEILRLRSVRDQNMAECVRRKDLKNNLEGKEVPVVDSNNNQTEFAMRKLSKLDNKKPNCARGLEISKLNFNQTIGGNGTYHQPNDVIELRQFNESVPDANEGNVYIDGKPVCDDGWDKSSARVACRMLGFADGDPTVGSQYGNVENDMAMDDISCRGDEASLYECDYSSYDNCGEREGAGVVCSDTDGSTVSVDLSGKLVQQGQDLDTEQFCLSEHWESVQSGVRNSLDSFDGTVALSCDQCKEEVLCFYVKMLFESLSWRGKTIRRNHEDVTGDYVIGNILVNVGDKNGDDEINFEEFKSKIVEYLTIAFNILDRNKDGSIDEVLSNESIKEYSLEFFEKALKNVVEFFDDNEDNSISTEDFTSGSYEHYFTGGWRDGLEDGKVTIYEFVGLNLINLPAPIYTAYTLVDEDQDEKFTMEELLGFLRRTFTIIDKNGDCYINLEELIAVLNENNLPEDFQLAMKLIGQQYLTLAKYLVDGFISKADSNADAKVTLEEIVKFTDFDFIDSSIPVIEMGYPTHAAGYLVGSSYRYGGPGQSRRDAGDNALVVWLTTLNTFLDNPVYKSEPSTQCGLADQ